MRYFITTFGCQANYADSERIEHKLQMMGHEKTSNKTKADLIVINACSVRQSAIDRLLGQISKIHDPRGRVKIIVAGCILEADKKKLKGKVDEFWHPDEYFDLSPIYSSALSAQIPIMTGCNNFCAYCAVPYTRGRERSRPADEIIAEIKLLIKKGYKDVLLLGQNVNSYSDKVKAINFAELLKIIDNIPGNFKINFLTSHPKDISNELIKTMAQCKKLKKELHLPVQSGDDEILKKMNRRYTTTHYKNLVKKIREAIPGIKISTDIIVGFPGETKKQFKNTVKLAKAVKFDKAYVAKYSPRSDTAAAKLKDDIPFEEKKKRWQTLDTLINKFEH